MSDYRHSRRHVLLGLGTTAVAGVAGCIDTDELIGDDDPETPTPPDDDPPDDDPPDDGVPGMDVTVEPETEAITYGEEYTVSVTTRNRGDEAQFFGGTFMARVGTEPWTDVAFGDATQIPAGEERTETYVLPPPTTGDLEFSYVDPVTQVALAQWNLTVEIPRAAFGEPNRFYDGLALTADLELRDAMEMPVEHAVDDDPGPRSIDAPAGSQWVLLTLELENASDADTVNLAGPFGPDVFLTSNGVQQEQHRRISWIDAEFEDQLSRHESVEVTRTTGYFDPPTELAPGGRTEGWLLFTAPEDATPETLEASLMRSEASAWDPVVMYWDGG